MPQFLLVLLVILSAAGATSVHAATLTWPSAAPCDTTLSACIAAADAADTVQIASDGPIDEDLWINKPMRLVAADGYAPRFATGRFVRPVMSITGSGSIEVEGLTLDEGDISVRVYAGSANVRLHRNIIRTSVGDYWGGAMVLSPWGAGTITYEISENLIELRPGSGIYGITISGDSAPAASISGRISENRILSRGTLNSGIHFGTDASPSEHVVHANRVEGDFVYGIVVSGFGPTDAQIIGNLIRSGPNKSSNYCISVVDFDGDLLDFNAINNTVSNCWAGIFASNGETFSGSGVIANNILAWNDFGLFMQGAIEAGMANHHNLFWQNAAVDGGVTIGPDSLFLDPLFVDQARGDLRLSAGSPALASADSSLLASTETALALPRIDALGRRRSIDGLDMGTLEHGDLFAAHTSTAANVSGSETVVDDPTVTGPGFRASILGATRDPGSYPALSNPHPSTTNYQAGSYRIRNEDGADMPLRSGHSLFAPAPGWGSFNHVSTMDNVSGFATVLDAAGLNNEPDRFVLVTPVRGAAPFVHPVAPAYLFGSWAIFTLDNTPFPENRTLNIYSQEPSVSAFKWRKEEAGGTATRIRHPLFDANPCTHALVGHGYSTLNAHPVELDYRRDQGKWWIRNSDGATMPQGAEFNVLVDEAATGACVRELIFHDGVHPDDGV